MEFRKMNLIANKAGGSAGKGSYNYKVSLPSAWIREMGLSENERGLILKFEEDAIVIKKDSIFLVVTEDGNIIYDLENDELQSKDQPVYESDIENLVEIELDDSIYENDKEDFENEVDYYLQNAIREDYATHWIKTSLDTVDLTEEAYNEIQEEVISRIKSRCQ